MLNSNEVVTCNVAPRKKLEDTLSKLEGRFVESRAIADFVEEFPCAGTRCLEADLANESMSAAPY
jgi:hypothetical protein